MSGGQKEGPPSQSAKAGQENIETVHEPKPIHTADTLCGQGRRGYGWSPTAHKLSDLKEFMPSR